MPEPQRIEFDAAPLRIFEQGKFKRIAGADLLALNRSLDGDEPALAIYHSHPNGRAYFSGTDREVATSPWGDGPMYPCQQIVVGVDEGGVRELAWFAWSESASDWIEVGRERA